MMQSQNPVNLGDLQVMVGILYFNCSGKPLESFVYAFNCHTDCGQQKSEKDAKEPVETNTQVIQGRHEGGLPRAVAIAVGRLLILGTLSRQVSGWWFGIC